MPLRENSPECSEPFRYQDIEPEPEVPEHRVDAFEFARRLVSYIRAQPRCRLTVDCLFLALGDADLEEITMTTVGDKHGITKAAVSKRVKQIRADLHLPPNGNNKSAQAVQRYSQTNRSNLSLGTRRA